MRPPSDQFVLQRMPHLVVPFRGPDTRIAVFARFVVAAGDVERQAVLEDHPTTVLWREPGVRLLVAVGQRLAGSATLFHAAVHVAQECARAFDRFTRLPVSYTHLRA